MNQNLNQNLRFFDSKCLQSTPFIIGGNIVIVSFFQQNFQDDIFVLLTECDKRTFDFKRNIFLKTSITNDVKRFIYIKSMFLFNDKF